MNEQATITEARSAPLCDAEGPIPTFPPLAVDPATGRMLPMSDEERAARHAAAVRAIDAIAKITDETDTDEIWEEAMRDLDAHRPHRKLFEGLYRDKASEENTAMATQQITLEVDADTAEAFAKVPEKQKKTIETLLGLWLKNLVTQKNESDREQNDEI